MPSYPKALLIDAAANKRCNGVFYKLAFIGHPIQYYIYRAREDVWKELKNKRANAFLFQPKFVLLHPIRCIVHLRYA